MGIYDNAIVAYEQALQLKPLFPECYNNLGAVFSSNAQQAEANYNYRKGILLKPDYSEVYYNQHGLSVNLDTALKFIERAHVTQPSNHNIMITNFGLKAIGGSSENFNSMDRKRFDKNPFKRSFDWFFFELEKLPKSIFRSMEVFSMI